MNSFLERFAPSARILHRSVNFASITNQYNLKGITSDQIKDVELSYVKAFFEEPLFRLVEPNPQKRTAKMQFLVKSLLKIKKLQNAITFTPKGSEFQGASFWMRPNNVPTTSLLQMLKAGLAAAPFKLGLSSLRNMMRFSEHLDKTIEHMTREPHWLLDVIFVDEKFQRRGLGYKLMQPIFEESFRSQIPCYVVTHNTRNVDFYTKYGFELFDEDVVIKDRSDSPVSYCLRRPWNK